MRYSLIVEIVFLLLQSAVSYAADDSPEPLLSSQITVVQNTESQITLSWTKEESASELERVLLFVPGPVSSATYTVSHFTWKSILGDGAEKSGDEKSFPRDRKRWDPPRIAFRELGLLAGSRLAALEIKTSHQVSEYSNDSKETVVFPSGKIEIRFAAADLEAFKDIPQAVDEIVRKLTINYPPLRACESAYTPEDQPPYFSRAAGKLTTRAAGVISIPGYQFLRTFGAAIEVEDLALFRDRAPLPFIVLDSQKKQKSGGELNPGDLIQFYSPGSLSPYSPDSVVWFACDPQSHRTPQAPSPGDSKTAPEILERRLLLEEDRIFLEDGDKNENQAQFWMWHDFIQDGTKTISFALPAQLPPRSATAFVRMSANQAYISPATDALYAELNGHRIPCLIDRLKPSEFASTMAIAPEWLRSGTNTLAVNVRFDKQSTHSELGFYLDKIDLRVFCKFESAKEPYWISERGAAIAPPAQSGGTWLTRNQGVNDGDVCYAPPQSGCFTIPDSTDTWRIDATSAAPTIPSATFEIFPTPLKDHPLIADSNGADVLLIGPRDWLPLLQPFEADLRISKYRVRSAAIEDIYNLFGDGRLSPQNLREFLRFAYYRWERPHPSYVLLVGDASWDYWSRYNLGVCNYVPSYREMEKYAVENWFVRCDDPTDKLPDALVARWPVQSATDVRVVVDKTLRYKNNPPGDSWLNKVFVLTDDSFEKYSQELIDRWIPPSMRQIKRHIADYPLMDNIYLPEKLRIQMRAKTSPQATDEVIQILSQGVFLWDYFGHGAPNVLGEERMFFGGGSKFSDARKLTNQSKLPMLWAFTCQTAEFDYPREKWNVSIGEDMLTFPGGGVIALVGATGRGYPTDHIALARGMHQAAFRDRLTTLGQVFFAANLYGLSQMSFFEPMNQFVILGDPTIMLPEFHDLQGEAQRKPGEISFQWRRSPGAPNPGQYRAWAETDSSILTDSQTYNFSQDVQQIAGSFQIPGATPIRKIGLDSIEFVNRRAAVTHGSIAFWEEPQSASFVEPVTGRLPNLTFIPGSLTFEPNSPRSGETVYLRAIAKNEGAASAAKISVQGYEVSKDNTVKLLNVTVGRPGAGIDRLDPGQQASVLVRWDPTDNPGQRGLRLTIDADKQIAESNEDDNSIAGEIRVARKADLIVDATAVKMEPIEGGKRFLLSFGVRNQGESPAEKIVIELTRKDKGIDAPEPFRIPQTFTLKPGEFRTFGGIKTPGNVEYLEITLDPDELVDEETHDNNQFRYTPEKNQ